MKAQTLQRCRSIGTSVARVVPRSTSRWHRVRYCVSIPVLVCLPAAIGVAADADASTATLVSRGVVIVATIVAVVLCLLVHYEALSMLTIRLRATHVAPRRRILFMIFALLGTHVAEIWIFGVTYFLLLKDRMHGALLASHPLGLLDSVYFSAVCYTTLGLGDIVPAGDIRFLVGTETLTGFLLITWSASFTFVEMQRYWRT